ncbi:hypothetical protein V8C40DRAFT_251083 [Trichoderma camerunense]
MLVTVTATIHDLSVPHTFWPLGQWHVQIQCSDQLEHLSQRTKSGEAASSLPCLMLMHFILYHALLLVDCVLVLAVLQSRGNPRRAGKVPQHPITKHVPLHCPCSPPL